MAGVDLTVRGAGIFGLSIAWAAARRGARVRVIDPFGIGAGASGGVVGALAPHVPERFDAKKAFQLESLLIAEGWWAAVAEASGEAPGYARTGRLQPLPDAAAVARARTREETAATLWQGRAVWRVVPARADGWAPPSPSGLLVEDTLSARIHPRRALLALVAAIRATSGEVVREGEEQGPVVHATGPAGLAALAAAVVTRDGVARGDRLAVKGQAARFRCMRPDAPQLFVDGLHVVPHDDGTVAIGSTSERAWDDPVATDAGLDALVARARLACPALAGAVVVERWAGLRPRAPSRAPVLGPWPGRAGHFVANGGFKIGFGMAPRVAEVMADLVQDDRDRIPDAFRVEASWPGPS